MSDSDFKSSGPGSIGPDGKRRPRVYLDNSINITSIVAVLTALASGASAWISVQRQIAVQDTELRALKELVVVTNEANRASLQRIERSVEQIQLRELNNGNNVPYRGAR